MGSGGSTLNIGGGEKINNRQYAGTPVVMRPTTVSENLGKRKIIVAVNKSSTYNQS